MLLYSSRGFPTEVFRAHIYSSVIFGGSMILTDAVVAVEEYHSNYYRAVPTKALAKTRRLLCSGVSVREMPPRQL